MTFEVMTDGTGALETLTAPTDMLLEQANTLEIAARAMTVDTPEDYRHAAASYIQWKAKLKELDAERRRRTDPINLSLKLLNADFKRIAEPLEVAVSLLNGKLTAFKRREEAERAEAEARAEAERRRIEAETRAEAEAELKRMEAERAKARELEATKTDSPFQQFAIQRQAAQAEAEAQAAKEAAEKAIREGMLAQRAIVPDAPPKTTAPGTWYRKTWKFRIVNKAIVPRDYLMPDDRKLGYLARTKKDQARVPGVEFYCDETIAG